jgi:hypothetical protein
MKPHAFNEMSGDTNKILVFCLGISPIAQSDMGCEDMILIAVVKSCGGNSGGQWLRIWHINKILMLFYTISNLTKKTLYYYLKV